MIRNNKFPVQINAIINDTGFVGGKKRELIKQELKFWYLHSFQKNNRWNRTMLMNHIKDYSDPELRKLGECFKLLFNTNNQYHQVFIRYLQEYQTQKEISKSTLGTPRLKVSQNTFEEIIHYFGELKRADQIDNTNKEIAKILKLILDPDKSLKETTIIDRLMNKKGYC